MPSILNATTTSGLVTSADNSGSLQLQTNNGTTAVTIDTSQRVGVGTTTPASSLHVAGSSAQLTVSNADASVYTYMLRDGFYSVGGRMDIYTGGANAMTFWTNANERMRINSSGRLCVNTTSGDANIHVVASSGISPLLLQVATNGDFGINFRNASNTTVGSVAVNASSTAYNTSSDYRLKENIAPMTGALAKVSALKPVTYTWKSTGKASQGFIAHELQEVVPDCVTGEKDAVETYTDEEGNEQTRPVYQGVDTSFLVATLTAAIQELKAELDATKAEVQALKGVA